MVPFFMRKKSCQKDWPRVPERFEGIQVNGCGAPDCENFGLSPVPEERICKESNRETDDRQIPEMPEPFRIQGTGLNAASLTCKSCEARKQSGEYSGSITSALKSNQAVAQELHRTSRYLSGPDLNCPNGCTLSMSFMPEDIYTQEKKPHPPETRDEQTILQASG